MPLTSCDRLIRLGRHWLEARQAKPGGEARGKGLDIAGRPTTDKDGRFTRTVFIGLLTANGIAISVDGCSAWRDNVSVERILRPLYYEAVDRDWNPSNSV